MSNKSEDSTQVHSPPTSPSKHAMTTNELSSPSSSLSPNNNSNNRIHIASKKKYSYSFNVKRAASSEQQPQQQQQQQSNLLSPVDENNKSTRNSLVPAPQTTERRGSIFAQFKNKLFKNTNEATSPDKDASTASNATNMHRRSGSNSSTNSSECSSPTSMNENDGEESSPTKRSPTKAKHKKKHKNSAQPASQLMSRLDAFHDKQENALILKQAYYSLLCAILDPTAHMREKHSFHFKTFNKLTTCDECKSILWGINKQGLQCQKCFMNIHEKCQELIQEDCAQQRVKNHHKTIHGSHHHHHQQHQHHGSTSGTSSSSSTKHTTPPLTSYQSLSSTSSLVNNINNSILFNATIPNNNNNSSETTAKTVVVDSPTVDKHSSPSSASSNNNTAFLQLALVTRYEDIKRAYPSYFAKLSELFKTITDDCLNDVKQVQKDYLNKNVRQMKTRLKIFVKNACNLIAKDSNGTSDPYVTIQCGFSKLKRTKTQKKNLNPVWNETIEFEYYNTADGISGEMRNGGDKLLIRVWDEDVGIKAHLDKMLTKESDDFLGQCVLDIHNLNLNGEQAYQLKPRTDGSIVTGYIVMSFALTTFEVGGGASQSSSILNNIYNAMAVDSSKPKVKQSSYLEQYRCLHKHIFEYCMMNNSTMSTFTNPMAKKVASGSSNSNKRRQAKLINEETDVDGEEESSNRIDQDDQDDQDDRQSLYIVNERNPKWLLECMPSSIANREAAKSRFFRDFEFNLILKQFSNKYVINELQKQMIHLECYYSYFVDQVLLDKMSCFQFKKRDCELNCKVIDYIAYLMSSIAAAYSINKFELDKDVKNISAIIKNDFMLAPKTLQSCLIDVKENRRFLRETCVLPSKLMLLLGNYRNNYPIKYKIKSDGTLEIDAEIDAADANGNNGTHHHMLDELRDTVTLFKSCCDFIQRYVLPKSFKNVSNQEYRQLFDLSELKARYPGIDQVKLGGYSHDSQIAALRKCIECSLSFYFTNNIYQPASNHNALSSSTSSLNNMSQTLRSSMSSINKYYRYKEDGSIVETDTSLIHNNHNNHNSLSSDHSILIFNIQTNVESLLSILSEKLFVEIEINAQLYAEAFYRVSPSSTSTTTTTTTTATKSGPYSINDFNMKEMSTRLLMKSFLHYLFETIKNDKNVIHKLRPEHVKLHLNLYILLHKFLVDSKLDKLDLVSLLNYTFFDSAKSTDSTTMMHHQIEPIKFKSLNEFFQPFLIEFIYQQEDQFIKYVYKIYDIDKISKIAMDVSSALHFYKTNKSFSMARQSFLATLNNGSPMLNQAHMNLPGSGGVNRINIFSRNDTPNMKLNRILCEMENYYSTSVTDLFTILHELLQTIIQFDSDDSNLNLMHQMCFVNLIKSKLLTYSSHVKKEYQKLYKQVNDYHMNNGNQPYNNDSSNSSAYDAANHGYDGSGGGGSGVSSARFLKNQKPPKSIFSSLTSAKYGGNGGRPSIFLAHNETRPTNQLTITTCILMNNFKKIIELLDEIANKLKCRTKIKKIVLNQLDSIKSVLYEDLNCMIEEYSREYQTTLMNACQLIQMQLNGKIKQLNTEYITLMDNLIDEILYNALNDKFMLCKTILFDDIFKKLLEEIFKISVKCVEDSIILKNDGGSNKLNIANLDFLSSTQMNNASFDEPTPNSPSPSPPSRLPDATSNSATNGTLFNKMGKLFGSVFSYASADAAQEASKENASLLNRFQYKIIQHALMHIIEFFSADEACLTKDYLLRTLECQCAFKTLDLYLNSFNTLISNFIKTQNMQQNNIDFSKTFGKLNIEVEIRQNPKFKNEFQLRIGLVEMRDCVPAFNYNNNNNNFSSTHHGGGGGGGDSSPSEFSLKTFNLLYSGGHGTAPTYAPCVEIYALGPFEVMSKWPRKLFKCQLVDTPHSTFDDETTPEPSPNIYSNTCAANRYLFKEKDAFEFKLTLNNDQLLHFNQKNFLDDFEIQVIVYDTNCPKQFKITGMCVFNLNQSISSAHIWKKLKQEDNSGDAIGAVGLFGGGASGLFNFSNDSGLIYGAMNLWLPLRPRLKISDDGYKILKVLDSFNENKRVMEFLQLKYSSRCEQSTGMFHTTFGFNKQNKNILDLYLINEDIGGEQSNEQHLIEEEEEDDDVVVEDVSRRLKKSQNNGIEIKVTKNDF